MVTLTLSLDQATGKLNVDGPISDKMLCYAMMELAKDIIRDYVNKQTSLIQPVSADQVKVLR